MDERIVSYLQMTSLYHLTRLNETWFRLDEPLVNAFVERWHPEMHTFHMSFGEYTITLQDVAYQLGLPIVRQYVMPDGEQLGVSPHANCNDKFTMRCSWMQDTFGEIPDGADDATIRRYARAYIVMLLGTLLFSDKSVITVHMPRGKQKRCEVSWSIAAASVMDLLAVFWFQAR
ncbi:protein MAIN-LIKE 2-like [Arachis hypogaea]|uniref:protein MAIN-LIKE 2-like n=1 Tax=Arachis hypogaea TaxID=3818 RepID=UPI0011056FE4|nr:protein MAIN-LIKE 2-like [Arachis hypogaea]